MSSPRKPPRLRLSAEVPTGRRAAAWAAGWLGLAAALAFLSVFVAVNLDGLAPVLRAAIMLGIAPLGAMASMLASDSAERALDRGGGRWGELLYVIAIAVVTLAVVVGLGTLLKSLPPDRPGFWNVTIDFAFDLALGLIAGALATLVILLTGWLFGGLIFDIQSRLGSERRAGRWQSSPGPEQQSGGIAGQLLRGAALGAAGLLLSAACTAIVTTVTTNRTGGAEAPAPVEGSVLWTVVAPLLLWFVGAAAAWFLLGRLLRRGRRAPHAGLPHRRVRHGTHAVALGVCLILVFVWLYARDLKGQAERRLWSGAQSAATAPVGPGQWSSAFPYLAQQFEPRFWLSRGERWSPTSVGWYLRQSGSPSRSTRACEARGCLQIRGAGCDMADPPAGCAPSGSSDPALYYRYFDSEDPIHKPRAPAGSWKLIEYWIFYNYDSLHAGALTQWHQADWEQVSVLVRREARTARAVEVAFSEHCYGARLPAERVKWAGSHPLVFVAQGSHANYPRPVSVPARQLRCSLGLTTRYLGVAGLFYAPGFDGTALELPVEYVAGIRDHATRGRPIARLRLLDLRHSPEVTGFHGFWGLDNKLVVFGIGPRTTGAGPPAPSTQGPWKQPFAQMLCDKRWLHMARAGRSETGWVCPPR